MHVRFVIYLWTVQAYISRKHQSDLVVVYERAGVVFAFNFHPTQSYADYKIGVEEAGTYPLHVTAICSHVPFNFQINHNLISVTFFNVKILVGLHVLCVIL